MTTQQKRPAWPVIIKVWLVAGTLDISIACIQYYLKTGKGPSGVLKFVASGFFGKEAFIAEGNSMSVYGLLFHYLFALVWTIIFFMLYPKIKLLRRNIFATAIVYGLFVWLIMNRVVMPLSKAPLIKFDPGKALVAMLILVIAIGLPLSFSAEKHYRSN